MNIALAIHADYLEARCMRSGVSFYDEALDAVPGFVITRAPSALGINYGDGDGCGNGEGDGWSYGDGCGMGYGDGYGCGIDGDDDGDGNAPDGAEQWLIGDGIGDAWRDEGEECET